MKRCTDCGYPTDNDGLCGSCQWQYDHSAVMQYCNNQRENGEGDSFKGDFKHDCGGGKRIIRSTRGLD